jgi:hypothetical protein
MIVYEARSCRSMDRTLPCEGRNAGSIPARSTRKKTGWAGFFASFLFLAGESLQRTHNSRLVSCGGVCLYIVPLCSFIKSLIERWHERLSFFELLFVDKLLEFLHRHVNSGLCSEVV